MAESFPSELQDKVNEAGFEVAIGKTTIETQMDIPPKKRRRRFTKSVDMFRVSIDIDIDEWQILYEFFDTTLAGGVKTFDYNHPMTQDPVEFRMDEPITRPLGGRSFRVTMEWEQMP